MQDEAALYTAENTLVHAIHFSRDAIHLLRTLARGNGMQTTVRSRAKQTHRPGVGASAPELSLLGSRRSSLRRTRRSRSRSSCWSNRGCRQREIVTLRGSRFDVNLENGGAACIYNAGYLVLFAYVRAGKLLDLILIQNYWSDLGNSYFEKLGELYDGRFPCLSWG